MRELGDPVAGTSKHRSPGYSPTVEAGDPGCRTGTGPDGGPFRFVSLQRANPTRMGTRHHLDAVPYGKGSVHQGSGYHRPGSRHGEYPVDP